MLTDKFREFLKNKKNNHILIENNWKIRTIAQAMKKMKL